MLVLVGYIAIGPAGGFWKLREVFSISKSKSDDFRSGKVKVDGVEIAGTDRNF